MATFKDFRNSIKPNWCPGCGDFTVQAAIQRAAAAVGIENHQLAVVSGIGCSGRIAGYVNCFGFHTVHGRSLPAAQGVKMANRDLTVIASGGDGDGFAIGMGHTIHAMKRNMDITYIVMDNQIYGLTKGQTSPSSAPGFKTKSTPMGSVERALSPIEMALAAGATFVGQAFSANLKQMQEVMEAAIKHKGFSFVNVFSPCVTFNKVNTFDFFKEHVIDVSTFEGYDKSSRLMAMAKTIESNSMLTGIIFEDNSRPDYQNAITSFSKTPVSAMDIKMTKEQFEKLTKEFM